MTTVVLVILLYHYHHCARTPCALVEVLPDMAACEREAQMERRNAIWKGGGATAVATKCVEIEKPQ
jgi:hypothetical protein